MKRLFSLFLALTLVFILCVTALALDYTVQPGDSFWLIAQKHGVTVEELSAANPQITDPSMIYVGQVIHIPTTTSSPSTARESLTYLYGGTTISYLKILDAAKGAIKTVNPDYFDVNPDGSLLITPAGKIDPAFVQEMHNRGVLVVPFISNHWDRPLGEMALRNREALSTQVAQMIETYNLDGVNIDIENVTDLYRQEYTDFTRLLRQKIPAHKVVSVAVAANPKGWTLGWHGSYDYKALSDYSDYLMIMAYDESYHGGPAGPVSSSSFFEGSIRYALNQGVPKNKIVVGIPFFGRYWKTGEAVGGIGLTANDVDFLLKNYESTNRYDTATQSANATVIIKAGDPKPKIWGGRILTEGTYNIWYDDLTAVRYKLDVIHNYDLTGAGSWALGQENTAVWDFYTSALNGTTAPAPTPTPSPAPNPTPTPAPTPTPPPTNGKGPKPDKPSNGKQEKLISILSSEGGKRVTSKTNLTRGDVAILLSELTYLTPEPSADTFSDTMNVAGRGQIGALKRRKVVLGTNGKFNPNQPMTRGDLAVMLDRMLVLPETIDFNTMPHKDVSRMDAAYHSMAKLYYFGIMSGTGRTSFNPRGHVSVYDFALISDIIDHYEYPLNPDRQLELPRNRILEPR